MKILLINPPWIKQSGNIWRDIASVMPPLGLAWMAACLEQEGHTVRILDAHAERIPITGLLSSIPELNIYDFVGITATTALIKNALKISKIIKRQHKDINIILGGVHPTVLPEEVLSHESVDLVVRGEGERTICEILAGHSIERIDGVSYRYGGGIRHNPPRKLIENLDSLPFPAYHLLPMEKYYPAVGAYKQLPATSVLATRGCPGRCTFCYRIFGKKLRTRSGKKIAEEVRFLQDNYGIREIAFYDDTFTIFKKEVYDFCQSIMEMDVRITWSCFSRADTVDEDLLVNMKKAGCHQIMYGIESACSEILNNVQKKCTLDKSVEAVRHAKKAGIDVRAAFMFGNPGETRETLEQTLAFAISLNAEYAVFNITTPYPGTEMYSWAEKKGYLLTRNWDEYDLSNPVMKLQTISPEELKAFYKTAHLRYYLRIKYFLLRLSKIKSMIDIKNAIKGLKAVLGI